MDLSPPVSHLPSPASRLPSPVSRLPSPTAPPTPSWGQWRRVRRMGQGLSALSIEPRTGLGPGPGLGPRCPREFTCTLSPSSRHRSTVLPPVTPDPLRHSEETVEVDAFGSASHSTHTRPGRRGKGEASPGSRRVCPSTLRLLRWTTTPTPHPNPCRPLRVMNHQGLQCQTLGTSYRPGEEPCPNVVCVCVYISVVCVCVSV